MLPLLLFLISFVSCQEILQSKLKPKVFIVAMFEPEEKAWTDNMNFSHRFQIPGLSPLHPEVHCVEDYSVCQFATGEGEINAAASMTALLMSSQFDFTSTYWLLTGIGGGDPKQVTTGSITFAKYAVQVGLQYQIDSREILKSHPDWPTGYFSYGTKDPWSYPDSVYGTEVFELNEKLRDRALSIAGNHVSEFSIGDEDNIALRKLYPEPANELPGVKACDVLTSDNYWTGEVLNDFFANYTEMITNGTATYCSAAQEENATLEAFIRFAKFHLVAFDRIIVMRSISNFVCPPAALKNEPLDFFYNYPKGGIDHSLENIFIAGYPIVEDILNNWGFYNGEEMKPENYIGDILGSLGGKPNFGKDSYTVR